MVTSAPAGPRLARRVTATKRPGKGREKPTTTTGGRFAGTGEAPPKAAIELNEPLWCCVGESSLFNGGSGDMGWVVNITSAAPLSPLDRTGTARR
ncbi:unnamed protein product [Ectocarpus sp. CCAP 1310/34]|nr:unnamed protein product [Ectocarpus sp. CCAP 1310/34]